MEYTVKWEIQVEATSPEAAARQALEIQRDVTSTATVFEVSEHHKTPCNFSTTTVDLSQ